MKLKKLLAFILSIIMIITVIPASVMATETEETEIDSVEENLQDVNVLNQITRLDFEVEEPEAGDEPGVPYCATEGVSIQSYYWVDEFIVMAAGETYVEGHKYILNMNVAIEDTSVNEFSFVRNTVYFNGKNIGTINRYSESEASITCEFTAVKGKNAISELYFDVEEPVAGEYPAAPVCTTEGVSVQEYFWLYDGDNMEAGDVFVEGRNYELRIAVVVDNPDEDKFSFNSMDDIYFNGVKTQYGLYANDNAGATVGRSYTAVKTKNKISELRFEVAEPEAGLEPGEPYCQTEGISIEGYYWFDDNGRLGAGDVFEEGKEYGLRISIKVDNPNNDQFGDLMGHVYINGELKGEYYAGNETGTEAEAGCDFIAVKTKNKISEVYFEVEEPVAGKTPAEPVCLTEGVSITNYFWVDDDGTMEDGAVFEVNKEYGIRIAVAVDNPDEDKFYFESMDVTYFNGEKKGGLYAGEESGAAFGCQFIAGKSKISALYIDVEEPEAGKSPAAPIVNTEGVSVDEYFWYGPNGSGDDSRMVDGDVFIEGKTYALRIAVTVNYPDKSEFGNIIDHIYFNDGLKGEYFSGNDTASAVNVGYNFTAVKAKNRISEVYIEVEEPEAGKTPAAPVCLTEGVSINSYFWFGEDGSGGYMDMEEGDVFVEGRIYSLRIGIVVDNPEKDKFYFNTLDDIYFNGVKTKGGLFAGEEDGAAVGCDFTAVKAKNRISELRFEVAEPVAGEEPAEPVCTTEGVSVEEYSWLYDGDKMGAGDVFVEGRNYGLRISIKVDNPDEDQFGDLMGHVYINGELKGEYYAGNETGTEAEAGCDFTAKEAPHVHEASTTEFTWADDGKNCTAHFVCYCGEVVSEEYTCEIESYVKTKATETEMGTTEYTASFTVDGTGYLTSKEVQDIPVLKVTAPVANKLTYTGSAQKLVTAGSANYGKIYYSLAETSGYSATIPALTNAGTYKVYYKATGDAGHKATAAKYVTVKIAKKPVEVTLPKARSLTYTGKAQKLLTAGETTEGKIYYSLTETGGYSTEVPTKTDIGSYKVYYKVVGDANHSGISATAITVYIRPGKPAITAWANKSTGIKIVWGKVMNASGYVIYRDGTEIKRVGASTLTYTDPEVKTAKNGASFTYMVKAYTTVGTSKIYCLTPVKVPLYRVNAPASFTLAAASGYVKVSYPAPSGVAYVIYRATSANGTYSPVKSGITSGTYWKDTGVTKGKTYYYKIKAFKTINGTKVYSDATAVKSITAK